MIVIRANNGEVELEGHVGCKFPKSYYDGITEVQADGDELQLILSECTNLPRIETNRVQHWFGDHAKFIVANLF